MFFGRLIQFLCVGVGLISSDEQETAVKTSKNSQISDTHSLELYYYCLICSICDTVAQPQNHIEKTSLSNLRYQALFYIILQLSLRIY